MAQVVILFFSWTWTQKRDDNVINAAKPENNAEIREKIEAPKMYKVKGGRVVYLKIYIMFIEQKSRQEE